MPTPDNRILEVDIALLKHRVEELEKKVEEQDNEIKVHHDYMTRFGGIQAAILAMGAVAGTLITWALSFWGKGG
jgi:hypothetical protein